LLRAAGLNTDLAQQIAARWSFRETTAFVAVYLADHAAKRCDSVGVLVKRCLKPDSEVPVLAANAPEYNAILLRQHITADDMIAWRAADNATLAADYRGAGDLPTAPVERRAEPDAATRIAAFLDVMRRRVPMTHPEKCQAELRDGALELRATAIDIPRLRPRQTLLRNLAQLHCGVPNVTVVTVEGACSAISSS
jgi:hypothetical protein